MAMFKKSGKTAAIGTLGCILMLHFTIGAEALDAHLKDPINKFITTEAHSQRSTDGNIETFSYTDCKNPEDTQITSSIEIDGDDTLKTGLSTFKPLKILNSEGLKNHILNWIGDRRLILIDIKNHQKNTKGLINILEWNRFKERSCSIEREIGYKNIETQNHHQKFQNDIDAGKPL